MPGFDNQVMWCANQNFSDPTGVAFDHAGEFLNLGDLAIGTGNAAPLQQIKIGHITGSGGIVISYSGGNININGSASGNLLIATHTMTNSEVKNCKATPVQIIASPGIGKGIVVVSACSKLNYGGTNAFTAPGSSVISLRYNNNTTSIITTLVDQTMITSTGNEFKIISNSTAQAFSSAGTFDNVNVAVFNTGSSEIGGNAANDNTIDIIVSYWIVTF